MTDSTPNFALPLLVPGQGQKEMTHNEALSLVDALIARCIERRDLTSPPPAPQPGQIWLVAPQANGAWTGRAGQFALFTAGGWRFLSPVEGQDIWIKASQSRAVFYAGTWFFAPAVTNITGGTNIDTECRQKVETLLILLKNWGLVAR